MIGLRSLATGLPAKLLLNPRKALADPNFPCNGTTKPQYVIINTSGGGDPFACNAPGTYDDGGFGTGTDYSQLVHPTDANSGITGIDPVGNIQLGKYKYTAAGPWGLLDPTTTLPRTSICHIMTNTPVHPKEPQVLQLMGATQYGEMFPSVLAKQLCSCLNPMTLQAQPISVGAVTPSEGLTFNGQALPTIPPTALSATLTNQTSSAYQGMTNLQTLRDQTLQDMYQWYKDSSQTSPAQRAYVDSLITSQSQVRGIAQSQLSQLGSITANDNAGQITAAITLIQMHVTPVIAVHFPFGGDNHADPGFAAEAGQTMSGMAAIASLMKQLNALGMQDQVTFLSLNVFGRTMDKTVNTQGRQHNQTHEVSMMIGSGFNSGVIGGVTSVDANGNPVAKGGKGFFDWGAAGIDSATGKAVVGGGDIAPVDSLASWGKTVMAGLGIPQAAIDSSITGGKVITAAVKS